MGNNGQKRYVRNVYEESETSAEEEENEDHESQFFVGGIHVETVRNKNLTTKTNVIGVSKIVSSGRTGAVKDWNIEVEIHNAKLKCQIDTGAQANLLSIENFNKLNIGKLESKICHNILTFSGERLPLLGKVNVKLLYKKVTYSAEFYVLNMKCKNVIGLELAIKMNLVKMVTTISCESKGCESLLQKYEEVFKGLGQLESECHLKLKENYQPVVDAPRRVPFGLFEPLKRELSSMMKLKVIEPVSEPTEWVNSIVLVAKPNGDLRVCLDPKNLNKAIVRPRFSFPNIDECKSQMAGSKIFSTLDANSGFWMIPLDIESSKLCTFNTPFGRYRFLRLPFGINAAPEIFHSEMIRLFGHIKGLIIYMDDFLIHAPNVQKHNAILESVLERAQSVGLRFNKSKSKFLKKEVKFVGHIFSEKGVKPDEEKIKSIVEMPVPKNVKELQRFLGMINYLGCFIDSLSAKTKYLRDLLKNDVVWHWDNKQEEEFQNLLKEITNVPVLTYFNPKKQLVMSVDASKYAVGAVIMHDRNPVAYASASLTETQTNYAQIEKELFAILYGCTRFHQYVYGRHVLVETDHKPLVTLVNKPLYKIPARLQRFMLRLLAYNITVVYKPGKDLFIADTLSRAPLKDYALTEVDKDIDIHCNLIISQIALPSSHLDEFREAAKTDTIFQKLLYFTKNGWPANKKRIDKELMPYYQVKDELVEIDGLLLKNNRVVVPKNLRPKILYYLHEGHMGIQRCQNLARNSVYWPNINNDLHNVVSSCEICLKFRKSNPKQKLLCHEMVNIPWYKLGADLFEFDKKTYLLVVDYYSKFIECEILSTGYSSTQVIMKLKSIFARQGIPAVFITDNGPPFSSKDFAQFCADWCIEHITSSPYMPRSNGLAERSVQTIKTMLYKCKEKGTDPYTALLHYRTTPKDDLSSPSELLMSRKLRTKLPSQQENLKSKLVDVNEYRRQINKQKIKMSQNYNTSAKNLKPVNPGEKIYFKKTPTSVWCPGTIIKDLKEPRSFMVQDPEGVVYRRN
ncbi:uncharacterized protein K02A2.6-like [Rhagoletis pomonella]|uniref:uncharacterized protein K02A2.6-like n=1 Tax=Rhagoletis pomonella TaxID=28610 RepID=UPI00177C29E8|nr:uncharacterized protein K02A2.6-like [Rhagoletis pomonella]